MVELHAVTSQNVHVNVKVHAIAIFQVQVIAIVSNELVSEQVIKQEHHYRLFDINIEVRLVNEQENVTTHNNCFTDYCAIIWRKQYQFRYTTN